MNGSTSTKRIALYLRVSSDKQTAECQRPECEALIAIMSWVAEQERNRLIERTNAGMRHARKFGTKSGKPIGRAQRFVDVAAARNMLAQGLSQRATAKAMGLPLGTLQRALARTAE
jgi:DNA invertase Pin-like site-specific DNA recombinase